jgi:O-antigen/teichoic acid export membrane protein
LQNLGVSDYGLYNVVGGVVALFTIVGGPMGTGAGRFFNFFLGLNDQVKLKEVFHVTVTLFLLFSIVAAFLLETVGLWFLNTKMVIPPDRMFAANVVFQLSVITFIVNYWSIPYNAIIISHENMDLFAYVSMFECFAKLMIVIALKYVLYDKLIFYALLICALSVVVRVFYQIYTSRNMPECRNFRFRIRSPFTKELLSFTGYNMIGVCASLGKQQGINILINLFFGVALNSAHSIAQQVSSTINQFVQNIYVVPRPRIMKLYAREENSSMWYLVYFSAKAAFFLLTMMLIPLLVELPYVLNVWLKEVPPHTVAIARLCLIALLLETLTNPLYGVSVAANKIKRVQTYSSTLLLLNIPIAYLVLRLFDTDFSVPYVVSVFTTLCSVIVTLVIAKKDIQLDVAKYVKEVILRSLAVLLLSSTVICWAAILYPDSLLRLIGISLLSVFIVLPLSYLIGLNQAEKKQTREYVKRVVGKFVKKK